MFGRIEIYYPVYPDFLYIFITLIYILFYKALLSNIYIYICVIYS